MDGHFNYRDYFGHGASSSGASSHHPSAAASENMELLSQARSNIPQARSLSAGRMGIEDLDLNSHGDGFPYLDDYTGYLHADHDPSNQVSGAWQPPFPRRPRGGKGGFVRGRSISRGRRGGSRAAASGAEHSNASWTGSRGRGIALGGCSYGHPAAEFGTDDPDDTEDNGYDMTYCHKANWSEPNIDTFCRIYVDEMRRGNCPQGQMSSRGWQNLAQQYYEKTKLYHNLRQLKNRRDYCKTLWIFYKQCMKDTGLGRDPQTGGFIASEKWWSDNTEKKSEFKKFKYGIPTYIDCLQEMFHGVAVDGSTSCIPEDVDDNEDAKVGHEDAEYKDSEQPNTPSSSSSRKRGSTTDTATSLGKKKSRSPMINALQGLVATIQATNEKQVTALIQLTITREEMRKKEIDQKVQEENAEIEKCLSMAIECGATEDSDEYFMATQLFAAPYNRSVFLRFKTNEGRIGYLRRYLKYKGTRVQSIISPSFAKVQLQAVKRRGSIMHIHPFEMSSRGPLEY